MNPNQLPSHHQHSLVKSSSSLAIIYNPSGDYSLTAGNTFSVRVTITNQGIRSALINIYVDETSRPLWEWCDRPLQQLALSVGESSEVVFQFAIPLTAIPDTYDYLLIVDAPKHYPQETPITHQSTLKILSPIESVVPVKDPTFVLAPETTSDRPLSLQSGQTIEIQALVFNNSERVDRFRLRCLDLPSSWYQIIYPEGVEELGLVLETKNLALNPGTKGKILLRLTLPKNINAGSYTATMQIYSSNNPDLVLLNLFYFQVVPIYKLNFQLNAIVRQVRTKPGIYEITIENLGNTKREIIPQVTALREDKLCKFTIEPAKLQLQPEQIQRTELQIKPQQWWRRPFFGQGMTIDFEVNFTDAYQLSLPRARLRGQLIWEARPWWHLLLLILTGVSVIATIIFLIWWLFFKPPAPPRIINFASASPNYQAINNDFIYLNWEIGNAKQIKTITLVGRNPSNQVTSRPESFRFNNGIPEALKPYCTLNKILACRNLRTNASRPGEYIFEIKIEPKNSQQKTIAQETNLIKIDPLPKPKIVRVFAQLKTSDNDRQKSSNLLVDNQAQIQNKDANFHTVFLSFVINYWEELETIQLVGRNSEQIVNFQPQIYKFNNGLPASLKLFCDNYLNNEQLVCQNIPLKIDAPGEYIFELQITSSESNGEFIDSKKSDTIEIAPASIPQIISFNSTQPTYQENNEISLNWKVLNPENLGEIQLISRAPEGIVNVPLMSYSFAQGIPLELEPFCQLNKTLICQDVPTKANQPGNYKFELTVISKNNLLERNSLNSDLISIAAPEIPIVESPLKITSFSINNEPAPPKYIVTINPQQSSPKLTISWQVESSPKARVELLPSPGEVPTSGIISYPLTPKAGQETLTLKVKDETGKQITRSVIIDKVISQQTDTPGTFSPESITIPKIDRQEIIVPSDLPPKF